MPELQKFPLITTSGERGFVLRRARFIDPAEQSRVVLEDGTELVAPSEALEAQPDGSFLLRTHAPRQQQAQPRQPVPQASATSDEARTEPQTRATAESRPNGHAANLHTSQHAAEALYADEVGIERVAVNQLVDERPGNREDGDILVIPVVEEVLVVQKRFMVKEEIRINRRRQQISEPRRILLDGSQTTAPRS